MGPQTFTSHYESFYGDPELSRWRDIGARDKAANVIDLWAALGLDPAVHVVEVGCGDGALIQELGRRGFGRSYVGYEVSSSAVATARLRQFQAQTRLEIYDGDRLPVEGRAFDLAVLSHVLEHVECPRSLLREAARVASHVFVEVPLELHLRTPRDFQWTGLGHVNLFNALLIRHLVQSAGMRVLTERVTCPSRAVMTHNRPGLWHLGRWVAMVVLHRVAAALACRLWTYHGCLVARPEESP